MKFKDGDTIVFTGDSITDCGRGRPVGLRGDLGNGYVSLINSHIEAAYPNKLVRVLNTGISGNQITDLAPRWDRDVLKLSPDWVSIFIGINDVWHLISGSFHDEFNTKAKFEKIYRELIEKTIPKLKGMLLVTPFYLETRKSDPMRQMRDEYGEVVRKLSVEYKTMFADTQAAFDEFLKHKPSSMISDDKVHPDLTGHTIIANCIKKALDLQ